MAQNNRQRDIEQGHSPPDIRQFYPEIARMLITRQNEILPRVAEARENLDQQRQEAPGDEADVSVLDLSADYFLRLANNQRQELLQIRDAFDRMDRGVYGICEACGEPIAIERLRKLPYARLCIDDQTEAERGQTVAFPRRHPKL